MADNLERAPDSKAVGDRLQRGMELIYRESLRFLSPEGVSPMHDVVGQPFDPLYHEAIATVCSAGEEGRIVEETPKGYLYNERPLRPAHVVVARGSTE